MITEERQEDSAGYVYKTTHLPTGRFYIGESTKLSLHDVENYLGSGRIIVRLLKKYPRKEFSKEILAWCNNETELYEAEARFINEELTNDLNVNIRSQQQGVKPKSTLECEECGGRRGQHFKECSKFNKPLGKCEECGCEFHNHYKGCSKYVAVEACPECGSRAIHKENCSRSRSRKICEECLGENGQHKRNCSKFKRGENWECSECGNKAYTHKATCSKYKERTPCEECGSRSTHKSGCSKYKPPKPCEECSGKSYQHFKWCSKYKRKKPPSKS